MLQQERQSCCSSVTGTKIFAVINIALAIIFSIFAIVSLVVWIVMLNNNTFDSYGREGKIYEMAWGYVGMGILILLGFSLTSLLFASYLVIGIFKSNPGHVKVYLVYGYVVESLCVVSVVCLTIFNIFLSFISVDSVVTVTLCVLYGVVLYMIRRAHKVVKQNKTSPYPPPYETLTNKDVITKY